nr:ataxin-2-like protein [Taeniopygia guttata]
MLKPLPPPPPQPGPASPPPHGGGGEGEGKAAAGGGGPGGGGRSLPAGKSLVFEGVYGNSRMLHVLTAGVGSTAEVRVRSGRTFEGIFRTLSAKFELALDAVHRRPAPSIGHAHSTDHAPSSGHAPSSSHAPSGNTSSSGHAPSSSHAPSLSPAPSSGPAPFPAPAPPPPPPLPPRREDIVDTMVFRPLDIVVLTLRDLDMASASRDKFTDAAIAGSRRLNGARREKVLERWDGGDGSDDYELDADLSNGWDPAEMFRFNEENYGVRSTYDSSLAAYTVPLARQDSASWRQRLARAAALAREIEACPAHRLRAALEDEEGEGGRGLTQATPPAPDTPPPPQATPTSGHAPSDGPAGGATHREKPPPLPPPAGAGPGGAPPGCRPRPPRGPFGVGGGAPSPPAPPPGRSPRGWGRGRAPPPPPGPPKRLRPSAPPPPRSRPRPPGKEAEPDPGRSSGGWAGPERQVKRSTLNPHAKEFSPGRPLVKAPPSAAPSPTPRPSPALGGGGAGGGGGGGAGAGLFPAPPPHYISYIPQLHVGPAPVQPPQIFPFPVSGSASGKFRGAKGSPLPPPRGDPHPPPSSAPPPLVAAPPPPPPPPPFSSFLSYQSFGAGGGAQAPPPMVPPLPHYQQVPPEGGEGRE